MDITFREILNDKGDSKVIQQFTNESFVPRVGDFVWIKNNGIHSYRVMSVSIEYVMKRHAYVMVMRNRNKYQNEDE